ncbi:MAG: signal peptidase II [bacterium]
MTLIAVFFITLDRWFKAVAINVLADRSWVITNWLQLHLDYNPRIAFSLPLGGLILNIIIALLILALIKGYLNYKKSQRYLEAGWILIVVFGAISNLFDRLRYGAVIDYINIPFFIVFNLADVLICSGLIALLYLEWQRSKKSVV